MDYFIGFSILYNISMISVVMLITGFVRTPDHVMPCRNSTLSGAYLILGTIKNPVAQEMEEIIFVIFYIAGIQRLIDVVINILIERNTCCRAWIKT